MNKIYDVCVIGGGVIGASITRKLSEYNLKSICLEKNLQVAMETSEGNSGVVHSGVDPTPGKLNAKLNLQGNKMYQKWFKELSFPHKKINTLIVGFNKEEEEAIKELYDRGLQNGLDPNTLSILNNKKILEIEPNLNPDVKLGLLATTSYAVNPVALTKVLFSNAIANNAELKLGSSVTKITHQENNTFAVTFQENGLENTLYTKYIVNSAGHYADEIAKMAGYHDFDLVTKRGEYRVLEKSSQPIVNNIVFMVPTIHGKGVIVAPMLDGKTLVGPTAEDNVPKDETRFVTQKMFGEIAKIGQHIIPTIDMTRTCLTFAGSRPIEPKSNDFYIKSAINNKHFINVAGTKSPGLSSAPAIAEMVWKLLLEAKLEATKNQNFNPNQTSILNNI